MRKIPTLFVRDFEKKPHLVLDQITPGCEWVANGQGVATRKYDGQACTVINGKLYKRFEAKDERLAQKPAPEGAILVDKDEMTAKNIFWVPVDEGKEDQYFREAWENKSAPDAVWLSGTYELLGPKVQGNPELFFSHCLMPHKLADRYEDCPRTFDALKAWLAPRDIEGIVFHGLDRMAKIKKKDFGLERKP
jgi:hypothetical protein